MLCHNKNNSVLLNLLYVWIKAESNRGPSARQPNALPLGQTGSVCMYESLNVTQPAEQRILRWLETRHCKATNALCNLLFEQFWGTKSQTVSNQNQQERADSSQIN